MFAVTVNSRFDKTVLGLIVTFQFFLSFFGLAMMFFAAGYGGASLWPTRFGGTIIFFLFGLVGALFLWSGAPATRIAALVWHFCLVVSVISIKGPGWIGVFAGLSFVYLVASSLPPILASKAAQRQVGIMGGIAALLGGCYIWSNSTVAGLEWQLKSSNTNTRCGAARTLRDKGPAAKSALPALISIMGNTLCPDGGEGADDTAADIDAIGGIDPLVVVMKDGNGPLGRTHAAWYLRRSLSKHRDRVADLKRAFAGGLKSNDGLVRQASVEALGDLGRAATDVRQEVEKLLNDPSIQVRTSASEALKKIPQWASSVSADRF